MKQRTSFVKRCLAFALALVLFVSQANMGLVQYVRAEENGVNKTIAEIIAENYDLTDAEKALLNSGYLVSETVSYEVPTDGDALVSVDTENKKISAKSEKGFNPVSAQIVVGTEVKENVALTNGEGTYEFGGNAFSVKVVYVLNKTVETSVQKALLDAAGLLKQGVKNLDDVAAQSTSLFALETAMPELVDLAENGYKTSFQSVPMSDAFIASVTTLNGQMTANGGKLNLSVMIGDYNNSTKTGYLMTKGAAMKTEIGTLLESVTVLNDEMTKLVSNINSLLDLGWVSKDLADKVSMLAGYVSDLKTGLESVNADSWSAANGAVALAGTVDYTKLDALVADLGELSAVSVVENLEVARTTLQVNMAMFNVTYKVVLNHYVDNELKPGYTETLTETLAEGAAAAEMEATLKVLEDKLLASGVYVDGKFVRSATEIPATLNEDLTITVTYAPKNFDVTIDGETTAYPYGWELTLPVHADPAQSYDYYLGEVYYAQGSVVTVEDSMTFTRKVGTAYTDGNLYTIISENYGTAKIKAILTSGAVKGNEAINYRTPSEEVLEGLVTVSGSTLKAQSYPSSYEGLSWVPYSYVVDGTEKLFNGAAEVVLPDDFAQVDVYYRLTMTNYTESEVRAIFELVADLVDEAAGQKSVMDRLAGYESEMGMLNKNMLEILKGMIDGYAGQYSETLISSMKATIDDIIKNSCAADGSLKINGIIASYNDPNNGGLAYYYQNSAYVKGEIRYLSEKLEALLGDPEGKDLLGALLGSMGFAHYVEKLDTLSTNMKKIDEDLAPVNEKIDTSDDAKLSALATALTMDGSVAVAECGSPYAVTGPVVRTPDTRVTVKVTAVAGGTQQSFSVTIWKDTALTQAQVNDLKAQVNAFVNGKIDAKYYNSNYSNGADLNALVGVVLSEGKSFTYTWTAKEYTVKIDGEADQTITVENLTITLPKHPQAANGMSYEYSIGGESAKSGIYTFTKAQLDTLFVNGVLTITRVEKNESAVKLEALADTLNNAMGFEAVTLVSEGGIYTGMVANIAASDMMNLMMGLLQSSYSYVGMNGEGFIYSTEDGKELSMQTLINALLNDEEFSQNTIIALGENGNGKLFTASMQLGSSADELAYSDLTFTMNLKSVPAELIAYVDYIKLASSFVTFHSDNGVMAFELNLPDQAYAVYASTLIAAGHVDKTEVNELTQKVPVQFLYDYLTSITGSEMDMITFSNTLELIGFGVDLSAYNNAYKKAMGAYNEYIDVTITDDKTTVAMSAPGKQSIGGMLRLLGINNDTINTFLPMLKEYKDGATIDVTTTGKLKNVDKTYYALVLDAQADGVTNKMEAPSSYAALAKETAELAGYSYIILTANVPGDLTIAGTTILDLNGFNVEGTINATGKLIIMDTMVGNNTAGSVVNVTGNATILAGCYEADVSSKLLAGCYLEDGMVRNAMYRIIEDENGNLNFVLDGNFYNEMRTTGYMPNATALAINIATDLVMNYANTAKIALGGYELVAMDFDDLVGLYASDNRIAELAKTLIGCFTIGEEGYENNAGFEGVVNMILADLLDFEAITNDTALFTYELTTAPWTIEIDHNETRDYATLDVRYNAKLEKTINVSLTVESSFNDNVAAMTGELAQIVVKDKTFAMIDLPTPTFSNKTLTISGAAKTSMVMDMSKNSNYVTVIGVVLGYGNPDKAAAIANALNAEDMDAMKKIVDGTSVEEIFTALKKLARNVDFAAMAKKVGVTIDVASAAELEAKFHLVLCAAGKALEELDITGMNSKLGGLYNAETGYYELTKENIFRDKEINVRSYSALIELEATLLNLQVKLFDEIEEEPDCLWGDADHDGVVDQHDASLVFAYYMGTLAEGETICLIRTDVDCNGVIDQHDASLILEYYLGKIDTLPVEG